jgi:hypothetical protein
VLVVRSLLQAIDEERPRRDRADEAGQDDLERDVAVGDDALGDRRGA